MPGLPPGLNLADDERTRVIGSVSATWALATIAVFLRFLCRRISNAGLWWDDYLMVPAYIFTSILSWVTVTYMPAHGFGKHIYTQLPEDIPAVVQAFLKSLFIAEVCYTGTIVLAKFSILTFYWRLFRLENIVRYSIIALAAVVSMWGTAVFIIVVTQCRPLRGFWDKTIRADCTVDSYKFFYGNSTPNIITDILLMIAPLPAIWTLHLELRQKISLSAIFLLGIFVTAVSITRLIVLVSLDITDPDVTWVFVYPQIWTCVELNIAVVCGCLPILRPLLLLITTGSATGIKAARSARVTSKGTNGSKPSRKSPWSSILSAKDKGAEASISEVPFVSVSGPESKVKKARYIKLKRMDGAKGKDRGSHEVGNVQSQINLQTEWTVSSTK